VQTHVQKNQPNQLILDTIKDFYSNPKVRIRTPASRRLPL